MVIDKCIYFLSDESGKNALYKFNGKTIEKIFEHNTYKISSASTDGRAIIFDAGGDLYLYDLQKSKVYPVNIELMGTTREDIQWLSVKDEINYALECASPGAFYLSKSVVSDGENAYFLIRGSIIKIEQSKEGFVLIQPGAKEYYYDLQVKDNRLYALVNGCDGTYLEILSKYDHIKVDRKFLSNKACHHLKVSDDELFIAVTDVNRKLKCLDLNKDEMFIIDENLPLNLTEDGYCFSFDSKFIAYPVLKKNGLHQIRLYNIDEKESFRITPESFDATRPIFHPDQKALYFTHRGGKKIDYALEYDRATLQKSNVYEFCAISLDGSDPFDSSREYSLVPIEELNVGKTVYKCKQSLCFYDTVTTKNFIFFLGAETDYFSFIDASFGNLDVEITEIFPSLDCDKGLIIATDKLFWFDVSEGIDEVWIQELKLQDIYIATDLKNDYASTFFLVHNTFKSFFYDQKIDESTWSDLESKYEPLLDRVRSRYDFFKVLYWMFSELKTLHIFLSCNIQTPAVNITSSGVPFRAYYSPEFEGYVIWEMAKVDPLFDDDTLLEPYKNLDKGMVITQVNHNNICSPSLDAQLWGMGTNKIPFAYLDHENEQHVEVFPLYDKDQLEQLWRRSRAYERRKIVDHTTDNSVGYIALNSMCAEDLSEFSRLYDAYSDKDAIILDLRYNTGGNIHSYLLDILAKKNYAYCVSQGFNLIESAETLTPKLVVLCNQYTASDAEIFITLLKKNFDATVIGTKTWGGGVGIYPDGCAIPGGGFVTIPFVAFQDMTSSSILVEREGAAPVDIVVDLNPVLAHAEIDVQLMKAIDYLMREKIDE
jgi:tricorn protease